MGSIISLVLGATLRALRYTPLVRLFSLVDKPAPKPTHPLHEYKPDKEAISKRYQSERAKRLRKEGVKQFDQVRGSKYDHFRSDVNQQVHRDPIYAETKVLIVGAGFAGLVAAVKLEEEGVSDFRIVDRAAGYGGTWYWNRYPAAACDVESLIYLPFLEETGYTPKTRFSFGPEIREQLDRIVAKWDLARRSHLQTDVVSITWDEGLRRWHVHTLQGDHFITQFVVLATGTLHEPKLPGIPGIERFQHDHFHSGRWRYDITGGDESGNLTKLRNKRVGIIGTGATAVQLVPVLAQDAEKLYVFQRTPSSVGSRNSGPFDEAIVQSMSVPGWQQARMDEFAEILGGKIVDRDSDAVDGLQSLTLRALYKEAGEAGVEVQPEEIPTLMQLADFRVMERLRREIDQTVTDPQTARKLQPWYSFMCKRPTFNNDYLATFNRPNVELVDTDGQGITSITEKGIVANGTEYPLDVLIYSTGFDFEIEADFARRTGINLVGTHGRGIDEKWIAQGGPATLFGVHMREFPNLMNIGPVQAGVTANWTHTTYALGEHIASVVGTCLRDGTYEVMEPTEEAEEDWARQNEEGSEQRLQYAQSCPPGYYNREGKPEEIPARWAFYPKGIMAWTEITRKWREEGSMQGMERR